MKISCRRYNPPIRALCEPQPLRPKPCSLNIYTRRTLRLFQLLARASAAELETGLWFRPAGVRVEVLGRVWRLYRNYEPDRVIDTCGLRASTFGSFVTIKPAIAGDLDAKGTIKHHREWWCLNPSAVNLCFAASNPWKPLFILDPSIIKPHETLPPNL